MATSEYYPLFTFFCRLTVHKSMKGTSLRYSFNGLYVYCCQCVGTAFFTNILLLLGTDWNLGLSRKTGFDFTIACTVLTNKLYFIFLQTRINSCYSFLVSI